MDVVDGNKLEYAMHKIAENVGTKGTDDQIRGVVHRVLARGLITLPSDKPHDPAIKQQIADKMIKALSNSRNRQVKSIQEKGHAKAAKAWPEADPSKGKTAVLYNYVRKKTVRNEAARNDLFKLAHGKGDMSAVAKRLTGPETGLDRKDAIAVINAARNKTLFGGKTPPIPKEPKAKKQSKPKPQKPAKPRLPSGSHRDAVQAWKRPSLSHSNHSLFTKVRNKAVKSPALMAELAKIGHGTGDIGKAARMLARRDNTIMGRLFGGMSKKAIKATLKAARDRSLFGGQAPPIPMAVVPRMTAGATGRAVGRGIGVAAKKLAPYAARGARAVANGVRSAAPKAAREFAKELAVGTAASVIGSVANRAEARRTNLKRVRTPKQAMPNSTTVMETKWTPYTNPDDKRKGWISEGGRVLYRPDAPGGATKVVKKTHSGKRRVAARGSTNRSTSTKAGLKMVRTKGGSIGGAISGIAREAIRATVGRPMKAAAQAVYNRLGFTSVLVVKSKSTPGKFYGFFPKKVRAGVAVVAAMRSAGWEQQSDLKDSESREWTLRKKNMTAKLTKKNGRLTMIINKD